MIQKRKIGLTNAVSGTVEPHEYPHDKSPRSPGGGATALTATAVGRWRRLPHASVPYDHSEVGMHPHPLHCRPFRSPANQGYCLVGFGLHRDPEPHICWVSGGNQPGAGAGSLPWGRQGEEWAGSGVWPSQEWAGRNRRQTPPNPDSRKVACR